MKVGDAANQAMSANANTLRERRKRPRKQRQPKACYLCRQRKVKCDGIPCSGCALRGESQNCSMEPHHAPRSRHESLEPSTNSVVMSALDGDTPQGTPDVFAGNSDAEGSPELRQTPESRQTDARHSPEAQRSSPIVSAPVLNSATMNQFPAQDTSVVSNLENLPADSLFAMREYLQQSQQRQDKIWSHNVSDFVSDGPNFLLPLQDMYTPHKSIADLCLVLPSNVQIQRYYQMYSDILLPLYPGIVNPDMFKAELQALLDNRDRIIASSDDTSHDASWFALLFSVLACGAQCLSTTENEAELNSKVFGSIALSCLRQGNFLAFPTVNSVQAMLHIGNSLRNDMNPGIAWSLLGLTIRHAQIIGCHKLHIDNLDDDIAISKIKLWWAVVWQDTIMALCYDRPSGTLSVKADLPPILDVNGYFTFTDVINRVCSVCITFCRQRLLSEEADNTLSRENAYQLVQKMEEISLNSQPHLLSATNCINIRQYVEYFAVIIYKSHAAVQIFQSTLKESPAQDHDDEISTFIIEKSVAIVEAFLRLRQFSILSSHYWSLLQASVSAAKILLTQVRAADKSKIRSLVKAFILSLKSSCDETIRVVNGFSRGLSQAVADLTMILET